MNKVEQTFGKYRLGKTLGKGYQAKVKTSSIYRSQVHCELN